MPRKRRRRKTRTQSAKKYAARYTKRYDWVELLRNMAPGDTREVRIPKACHLASNPPLVCAARMGIKIRTSCREEMEAAPADPDAPEFLQPASGRKVSILTITRLSTPVAIP